MMYEKPPVLSWPIWKYALMAFFLQAVFTFLIWADRSLLNNNNAPLAASDVLWGSGISLFALWQRWVWRKDTSKVRTRWLIWIGQVYVSLYLSGLLLAGAVNKWSLLLRKPWNWIINSALVLIFIGMWLMPFFLQLVRKNCITFNGAFLGLCWA